MAILKFFGPPRTQTEGRCDCFRLADDPEPRYREARLSILIRPHPEADFLLHIEPTVTQPKPEQLFSQERIRQF